MSHQLQHSGQIQNRGALKKESNHLAPRDQAQATAGCLELYDHNQARIYSIISPFFVARSALQREAMIRLCCFVFLLTAAMAIRFDLVREALPPEHRLAKLRSASPVGCVQFLKEYCT
jgi:hypothetical protein